MSEEMFAVLFWKGLEYIPPDDLAKAILAGTIDFSGPVLSVTPEFFQRAVKLAQGNLSKFPN